ncbi:hypothetical protein SAMN02745248_01011 [Hathewaya proteolytica DSM 3090]|uniref:Polymerase/histidinol phosphatase N-terminal domain-containing protein n=1 Tax=Hathewaya proteolytica DSM 3090 TaxID=1121331 RepID=A0A1M6MDG3_9CLOT|nr:PHP domain-containing protein [Hathewaya proteolytica]SHJ81508.1 hypothetical protein SAMN02745248_01011 [Hathewaya proteolytica DSM 3090]
MIIDTHLHENRYSDDSLMSLEEAVQAAKDAGLHAICVTDHDSNGLRKDLGSSFLMNDLLVIVGAEILTYEGDILVFGLEKLPEAKLHAKELLEIVNAAGGIGICAHPYRNNNRGLGDNIRELHSLLAGVETFNGSTTPHANLYAYAIAMEFGLGCFGAGDSHITKKVGCFATEFKDDIKNEADFIRAVKGKNYCPVMKKGNNYERINIFDTLK